MTFSPGDGVWDRRSYPPPLRKVARDDGGTHVVLRGEGGAPDELVERKHLRDVGVPKAKPRATCPMGLACEVHRQPLRKLGVG